MVLKKRFALFVSFTEVNVRVAFHRTTYMYCSQIKVEVCPIDLSPSKGFLVIESWLVSKSIELHCFKSHRHFPHAQNR